MGTWRLVLAGTAMLVACGGSTKDEQAAGNGGADGSGGSSSSGGGAPSSGGASAGGAQSTGAAGSMGGAGAAGSTGGGGGDRVDPGTGAPIFEPPSAPPPGPSLCGGVECAANEGCCLLTMKCFALSSPGECEAPEPETPDLLRRKACAANSHCAAGEYCDPGAGLPCGGPGFCQSRTNCGSSWGSPLCGCDGKTYPNLQTACLAGVRTVGGGRCGATINIGQGGNSAGITRTLCGQDSQCPSGERCCHLTGFCYDDAHAALCATPPPGTNYPCITNQDCFTGDFCDAPSCDGPGGCKQMEICDALLEPVCGCDGKTYVNPPCAASKGVRVASEGQCHQSQ